MRVKDGSRFLQRRVKHQSRHQFQLAKEEEEEEEEEEVKKNGRIFKSLAVAMSSVVGGRRLELFLRTKSSHDAVLYRVTKRSDKTLIRAIDDTQ